jgi:excisionase family DNA binding protein
MYRNYLAYKDRFEDIRTDPPAYMNIRQAAEYIGLSIRKLEQLKRGRRIPFIRIDGRFLFRKESIDRFLEKHEVKGGAL